jgi:hypothetical protein
MPTTIRRYSDGTSVEFDKGKFDNFCVFIRSEDGSRKAPLDVEYFDTLLQFSSKHGVEKVYADFILIYEITQARVTSESLSLIESIANSYESERISFARTLTVIHMGMVAEINKANTKLGKRIKRLGVHRLLNEGLTSAQAANFMRGLSWRDIDTMCTERGF